MSDNKYCYPNSDVLINKLNIRDSKELFQVEKALTISRLQDLQETPIKGNFDFNHLKAIHKYIFQDIYDWAGMIRTVEIGKGNLFCTTACINEYAKTVFNKYFPECQRAKDNFDKFIKTFADNYGDLNALHPFREGNGRSQREFARLVCLECGYDFNLSSTTHDTMLEASILSFNKADNSGFVDIFSKAIMPLENIKDKENNILNILTSDDLVIKSNVDYDKYKYDEYENSGNYDNIYKAKIELMGANKETKEALKISDLKDNMTETIAEKEIDDDLIK